MLKNANTEIKISENPRFPCHPCSIGSRRQLQIVFPSTLEIGHSILDIKNPIANLRLPTSAKSALICVNLRFISPQPTARLA